MATTKTRINITPPETITFTLQFLAKRDDVPVATKANELIKRAIEIEEDEVFNKIAESRDVKLAKFIDHNNAWK